MNAKEWIPDTDELFYAESLRRISLPNGESTRDKSWSTCIFKLAASDDRGFVAIIVFDGTQMIENNAPMLLMRQDYACHRVGPAVAAALGLPAPIQHGLAKKPRA